jgi:Cys-tRNA synthase (O-phospho-L-seryl-tRNA:Cys-tRNA synthase)
MPMTAFPERRRRISSWDLDLHRTRTSGAG